jgi:membrane peptidoglycan carboxypeptidase
MGVTLGNGDPLLRVPTLTLGTMEVTPLAMANAYATFAAHGTYCKPVVILDIVDRDGVKLPVPDGDCKRVIKREIADTVTVMLNGVVDGTIPGRTGQAMSLEERQVAGKTGTTNDSAAVWFAGYTPQLAAAVWVGDPRGGYAHPMKAVTIKGTYYAQVFGGTLPGPIWHDAMEATLAGTEPEPFVIKSKYGLTTKDPTTYVYVPPPAPSSSSPKPLEPPTFENVAPGTDQPADPPADQAPPAEPAPAPEPAPATGPPTSG